MKSMSIGRLLLMAVMHFAAMYFLMYAMVNDWNNVFLNLNNFYMAGIMTAPMLVIEGVLMGSMYESRKSLSIVMVASVVIFISFFLFIRQQTAIADKELIRSMIPHHSGAILMCEQSELRDAELLELCESIIKSQQSEIDQMKDILARFDSTD